MTVEGSSGESAGGYRKRRRSKQATRTAKGDWQNRFRDTWRAYLGPAMAALTLGWVGYVYVHTYQETASYSGLGGGMSTAEVRYAMGDAIRTRTSAGRERWLYHSGSQRLAVDFGADGRIANILCTSTSQSAGDCRSAHRVTLGMTEDEIWYRLGRPAIEQLDGTNKIIAYPRLGLTLRLAQYKVSAISAQPHGDVFGAVPAALRMLLP